MFWYLTKLEIQEWVAEKEKLEFVEAEKKYLLLSVEEWLEEYIYSDVHEVFFVEFPIILYEWLLNIVKQKQCFWAGSLLNGLRQFCAC